MRLPWLPFSLIDTLDLFVRPSDRVFEYGGGGSSLWFADRAYSVVSVEHDPLWAGILNAEIEHVANASVLLRSPELCYEGYVSAIRDYPDETFDIVVIDGRERVRCFEASRSKVKVGGIVIFDDVYRKKYEKIFSLTNWPCRVWRDFGPGRPRVGATAVFRRTE